jgi:arylsulfatase A-like enzyme
MRVIVFALNGCPAGWLGAYGNDWVGTPNLDRLAAEGVTFDRHVSDCPEPTAARRAWLGANESGLASKAVWGTDAPGAGPRTILIRANHPDTDAPEWYYAAWGEVFDARPRAEDASPLDELLRAFPALLDRLAAVPDFLLWVETDRLIPPWDVQQDVFEAYLDAVDEEPEPQSSENRPEGGQPDEGEGQERADEEQAVEWVEELEEAEEAEGAEDSEDAVPAEPAVALAYEPVPPYADPPTGPFDRSDLDAWDYLHRTFAAVVTKLDAELGVLFDQLRAAGLDRSAAWLVTSDFGHPLGEHGQIGLHRPYLHEELVHLPLFLRLPGAEQAGRRVVGFTQPPDVYPTVLSLLGVAAPAEGDGRDLLPLARGERTSARAFAVTTAEFGGAAEAAIRTDEWALLVPTRTPEGDPPREPLLFGKPDDRWEVNDLRGRHVERADELEAQLRAALRAGE